MAKTADAEYDGAFEKKAIRKMSLVSLIGNTILSAFKLMAGIVGNSSAMISDSVHSMSDVFSTVIAMAGVKISEKEADAGHPYGHERLECAASVILCAVLFFVGADIGINGAQSIIDGSYIKNGVPGTIAFIAAAVSIVSKEFMYRYTIYYANKINSTVFRADAWHHRSDALSSVGALIGIGGACAGFPVAEPLAGIVICLFIIKASIDIFRDAIGKMLDTPCGEEYEKTLSDFIASEEGVVRVDLLRTRKFGNKVYIDAEIAANGALSLREAHTIAEKVHEDVEKNFSGVKHIMIHVNPAD